MTYKKLPNYCKNDGIGNFEEKKELVNNVFSSNEVEVSDIDSDGDIDIFSL